MKDGLATHFSLPGRMNTNQGIGEDGIDIQQYYYGTGKDGSPLKSTDLTLFKPGSVEGVKQVYVPGAQNTLQDIPSEYRDILATNAINTGDAANVRGVYRNGITHDNVYTTQNPGKYPAIAYEYGKTGNKDKYGNYIDKELPVTPGEKASMDRLQKLKEAGLAEKTRERNNVAQWLNFSKGNAEFPPMDMPLQTKDMSNSEYEALIKAYNTNMQNKAFELGLSEFPSINVKLK